MRNVISVVTEGYPDEAVARTLCTSTGLQLGRSFNERGKGNLDKKVHQYNQAAKGWYWLILRDLNCDAPCAPELLKALLPQPSVFMQFRIVVRGIEAWLMGDAERLSRYLSIPQRQISSEPELVLKPKVEMVRLASLSKVRALREDMVPRPGSGAKEGPAYASRLAEFAQAHWRPRAAAQNCHSLSRCISALRSWANS